MQGELGELLKEIRNLTYLFPAFVIVLLAIFAYFFSLSQRQEKLQDEIQALRETLAKQKPKE